MSSSWRKEIRAKRAKPAKDLIRAIFGEAAIAEDPVR